MSKNPTIVLRIIPSIFSVWSLAYLYNDCRKNNISYGTDSTGRRTATYSRNILPFFPAKKHTYILRFDDTTNQNEFENLVSYEFKHPFMRIFFRPLSYASKLPYPIIE